MKLFKEKIALAAIATLSICGSSFGQVTDAVYSVNIIGMQKVEAVSAPQGGLAMISNPFFKDESYIDKVVGTSGVAGATAASADNIQIYDPVSQSFKTYWLFSSANTNFNRRWRSTSGFATNVYINPGMGVWYRNRALTNLTMTIVGDVVTDASFTNRIYPGLQILSYPYSTPIVLDDLSLTNGVPGSTAASADNIQVYNPATKAFQTYWLFSSANASFNRRWRNSSSFATNVTINPGQSFWYRSRSGSVMDWVEYVPYNLDN